jgi:hypothetical protein
MEWRYDAFGMHYSVLSLARKIGGDTLRHLVKPTTDNIAGVAAGVIAVGVEAHSQHWSLRAMWDNALETVILPWVLLLSFLFIIHLLKAVSSIYRAERVSFPNALGGVSFTFPWHVRWRCYVVATAYLSVPLLCSYLVWQRASPGGATPENPTPPLEPVLYLQPDTAVRNDKGSFALQLLNSGPDIDYIGFQFDSFVAWKSGDRLIVYRMLNFTDAPDPKARPLRTNQQRSINLNFDGITPLAYRYIASRKHPALPGMRITMTFRRYSDGKPYTRIWSYGAEMGLQDKTPIIISSADSPLGRNPHLPGVDVIAIQDIAKTLESEQNWTTPVFQMGGGLPFAFGKDSPPPLP